MQQDTLFRRATGGFEQLAHGSLRKYLNKPSQTPPTSPTSSPRRARYRRSSPPSPFASSESAPRGTIRSGFKRTRCFVPNTAGTPGFKCRFTFTKRPVSVFFPARYSSSRALARLERMTQMNRISSFVLCSLIISSAIFR